MNFSILKAVFEAIGKCTLHLNLSCCISEKQGFALPLALRYCYCDWEKAFFSSKTFQNITSSGVDPYEINTRIIMGFREIGRGYKSLQSLAHCMNLSSPMTVKSFLTIWTKEALYEQKGHLLFIAKSWGGARAPSAPRFLRLWPLQAFVNAQYYRVSDAGLSWLHSYLANRKQFRKVNGTDSQRWSIIIGVPQGPCLDPFKLLV